MSDGCPRWMAIPLASVMAWILPAAPADEVRDDWLRQDVGGKAALVDGPVVERVLEEVPDPTALRREVMRLHEDGVPTGDPRWLALYEKAAERRRAVRLAMVLEQAPRIIFIKRRTIRPSFFGYTEGQSDAQHESRFLPGSALCLLEFDGTRGRVRNLLEDEGGVFRDPAVSWDGKRLVFAWKKSHREDDYHLYELRPEDGGLRQLTSEVGVADFEPAFLPDGDLVFSSSRCVQTVDCWWTEVSNLYTCGPDGSNVRRLGFDQVHTVYPQVLDDGRVVYTRWDYNDRGQVFPQPLFQMNPDGTGQTEFYGNNSWFPTTITHARGIPGTGKVLAILCGHHSSQTGKLAVIDPALGRQENEGVQLVSPRRETRAERIDAYGQKGELFRYPYPLNESEWLVSYAPDGWPGKDRRQDQAAFGIYWMDIDGRRELLATDPDLPCQQPVPLVARTRPRVRASQVDLAAETGSYYMQDIHEGPGLEGVPRGTVKKLRIVALDFRAAGVGRNHSSGPGGSALVSTPISIGNGSWDVKRVLGEATVHEDGSAFFVVPARTPVYFQAVDTRGRVVQTMRSWSTLQPGERASCVGCHEDKNEAPPRPGYASAMAVEPETLVPFHGPPRGFSFAREVQPILDQHCIGCHDDREPLLRLAAGQGGPVLARPRTATGEQAFSLLGETVVDAHSKRRWSDAYLVLTESKRDGKKGDGPFRGNPDGRLVKWISSQSVPTPQPARTAGSTRSALLDLLEAGHGGVELSPAELEKIACWIDLGVPYAGDYLEANAWSPEEMEKYILYADKRRRFEEIDRESVRELRAGR
ncbi:hypothetical protein [Haloferula sp. A504]|uniref:HzsA-related protein n=1 Tax=Haloferula sp. A504 TaxID=3373601 RepID=UPI0031C16C52|nr:hypothetical protein [Verrucomicrobiaceae bacterium E54]